MIIELENAYVLHSRPFKDTSLLVDFFTENFGRLTLIAKGARQQKKKNNFLLQPFIKIKISWQGKSQLKTLTSTEITNIAITPESHCEKEKGRTEELTSKYLYSAFYANELLTYLLPLDEPNADIFSLYDGLLSALKCQFDLEGSLRFFEFSLLSELGYGIDFNSSASQAKIEVDKKYYYLPNEGFIDKNRDNEELAASYNSFAGSAILAIANNAYEQAEVRQVAKTIARTAINHLTSGKKIKSRELFI